MRVGEGISQTSPLAALPLAARAARASAVGRSRRGVETRAADAGADLPVGAVCARAGAAGPCAADAGVDLGVAGAGAGLCAAGTGVDSGESFTLRSLGTVNPIRAGVSRGAEVELKGTKVSNAKSTERAARRALRKEEKSLPTRLELVTRDLRFAAARRRLSNRRPPDPQGSRRRPWRMKEQNSTCRI